MKTKKIQLALFLLGILLFNWFFWQEELGLNLLLFNLFILGSSFIIHPKSLGFKTIIYSSCTCLITALMVFFYGSTIAKTTNFMALLLFIGYVHQPQLKAIFFAGCNAIINFFHFPLKLVFQPISDKKENQTDLFSYLKRVKLIVLPFFFLFIFYWIFNLANPKFKVLTTNFWLKFSELFDWLFSDISGLRILFFLIGSIIVSAFIYHDNILLFIKKEIDLKDVIARKRKKVIKLGIHPINAPNYNPLSIGLKNEFRSGILLIGSVNLLLLLVNGLDISWLWFNFEYSSVSNLSQFVHEGTSLLILSILLSMGIILYFFRKNINFLPQNKLIKQLSIVWIIQNVILVVSVGLRNFYYIHQYGLAYKRIGVIVFLLLTIVGLVTLILKITKLKSSFYLVKVNSIAVFTSFVLLSLFNWDVIITKHNLTQLTSHKVDISFLLSLSDNVLPLIDQNKHILDVKGINDRSNGNHHYFYHKKVERFLEKEQELSWLSTNLSKQKTLHYFNNN